VFPERRSARGRSGSSPHARLDPGVAEILNHECRE
jgi:hypothetical protein